MKKFAIKFLCVTVIGPCLFACKMEEKLHSKFLTKEEILAKIYTQNVSFVNNPSLVSILSLSPTDYYKLESDPVLTEIALVHYNTEGIITDSTKAYHLQFLFSDPKCKGKSVGYIVFNDFAYKNWVYVMDMRKGDCFIGIIQSALFETETRFISFTKKNLIGL